MRIHMKKFLFLVLFFTVANSSQAQQGAEDTIVTANNGNKVSYKLILEYGLSTGIKHYYDKWQ